MNPAVYVLPEFWFECGMKFTSQRFSDCGDIHHTFRHPTADKKSDYDEPCTNEGKSFRWEPVLEMRVKGF